MKISRNILDEKNLNKFLAAIPYAKFIEITVYRISSNNVILKSNINKWNLEGCNDDEINNSFMYGAIDTTAYLAILNRVGEYRPAVTLSLKISHLSTKSLNKYIYFRADCIKLSKDNAYSFVKVFQSDKKVIANANATFLFKPLKSTE